MDEKSEQMRQMQDQHIENTEDVEACAATEDAKPQQAQENHDQRPAAAEGVIEKATEETESEQTEQPNETESKQSEQPIEPNTQQNEAGDEYTTTLDDVKSDLSLVNEKITSIEAFASKAKEDIHGLHKLYHNEYAGRLRKVESDLAHYQNIEKGKAFDGILTEIAKLYANNVTAAEEISEPKLQKQMRYLFLDLLQILESHGISKMKSKAGDKRNAKFCQVAERVPTNDPALHDTVAKSVSVGFYIENRPLLKEMIHVHIYDELSKHAVQNNTLTGHPQNPEEIEEEE